MPKCADCKKEYTLPALYCLATGKTADISCEDHKCNALVCMGCIITHGRATLREMYKNGDI